MSTDPLSGNNISHPGPVRPVDKPGLNSAILSVPTRGEKDEIILSGMEVRLNR